MSSSSENLPFASFFATSGIANAKGLVVPPSNAQRLAKLEAWIDLLTALGWALLITSARERIQINPIARRDLDARGLTLTNDTSIDFEGLAKQLSPDTVIADPTNGLLVWQPLDLGDQTSSSHRPTKPLTPRETEIWRLLQDGKTPAEIAVILQRSRRTVEKHQQTLYRKLGVQRADQAILLSRP